MENKEISGNPSASTTSSLNHPNTSQTEVNDQISNSPKLNIPQFVLLQEPITNTFQHPQVLFNFEGETVPDSISKEDCIIIDFNENCTEILDTRNYSPHFYLNTVKLVNNHPFTPNGGNNKEDSGEDNSNNNNEDTTLLIEGVFSKNNQQQLIKNDQNLVKLLESDSVSNIQLINELEREFIISYEQFNQYLNR